METFLATLRGKLFILKCRFFNKNIRIKRGLKIYKKLSIKGKGKINIGANLVVGGIRGDDNQYVTLYTFSPQAVISIGDNVKLYAVRISSKFGININDNALIEGSGISDSDFHTIDRQRQVPENETKENCQVTIGNRVVVCSNSFINKGITVGDDTVILPGSIVNTNIPANTMAIGNPARAIKKVPGQS